MKRPAVQLGMGFIIGLAANVAGCYLYLYLFSGLPVGESLTIAHRQGVLGNVIGLGALPNLFIFFAFLRKNNYPRARGVLMAVFVAALAVLATHIF
ncbi:MAG: hypothetical protein ACPG7E_00340 [Marinirhabdus sp.]